jgi:hypothetical protein
VELQASEINSIQYPTWHSPIEQIDPMQVAINHKYLPCLFWSRLMQQAAPSGFFYAASTRQIIISIIKQRTTRRLLLLLL